MSHGPGSPKIADIVRERRITRVCHFTRFINLLSICEVGAILSRETMRAHGIKTYANDKHRYDSHLNHICTSIQYPNVHLLWDFIDRIEDDWIVLLLDPRVLEVDGVLFSPTNAAHHAAAPERGADGLEAMFGQTWKYGTRSAKHLPSTPTDLQAEALIPRRIDVDLVHGIAVKGTAELAKVLSRGVPEYLPRLQKIVEWPGAFESELDADVRNGIEPGLRDDVVVHGTKG